MSDTKYKNECINEKVIKLRLELHKEYETYGYSERVIKKSQELDKYIFIEQQELLKK
jgi:hypothetical protein